jgi:hypothetical protein
MVVVVGEAAMMAYYRLFTHIHIRQRFSNFHHNIALVHPLDLALLENTLDEMPGSCDPSNATELTVNSERPCTARTAWIQCSQWAGEHGRVV